MKSKNTGIVALIAVLLLSVPLIAMQFSDEVDWDLRDFLIMGILIFITGMTLDWAVNRSKNKHRVIVAGVIILLFLIIWAELAVGIVGSPISGS